MRIRIILAKYAQDKNFEEETIDGLQTLAELWEVDVTGKFKEVYDTCSDKIKQAWDQFKEILDEDLS